MKTHRLTIPAAIAIGMTAMTPALAAPPTPFKQTNIHFETNA